MKFEIKHRWSGEILFAIEADSFKLAIEAAVKSKANLSKADLSWANLSKANLSKADLSWANLSEANLSKADLSKADLSWADPRSLRHIKHDIWGVLLHAIPEVPFLRQAIIDGKVNGSVYSGECACLCGTIANARKCKIDDLNEMGISIDASSMAERFFMGIKEGDIPETNSVSKLVLQWVDEFMTLTTPKV